MKHAVMRLGEMSASTLRTWYGCHRTMPLRLAVALMVPAALVWLGYEFWRLVGESSPIWPSSPTGAADLKLRHGEVHDWFAGRRNYYPYPPASLVMLWPLLGWLEVTSARWLWAATTLIALGWLVHLVVRESRAETRLERVFVALIPLSMYATGATIGNGQLGVHVLPMLIAGLLLLYRRQRRWREDLLAAALILVTLVKPNISAPFFWIVVFLPGKLRPALLVSLGYLALTLFAMSFQEIMLVSKLLQRQAKIAAWAPGDRYSDLPIWLAALGLKEWVLPVSLLVLVALGFWIYCHRKRVDIWLLLGVTALVARFWTYHRWYDDVLILLPLVALFRIAKQSRSTDWGKVMSGVLLAITLLATLAPGGLYLFSPPWKTVYVIGQTVIWIIVLIFLLIQAWREKNAGSTAESAGRSTVVIHQKSWIYRMGGTVRSDPRKAGSRAQAKVLAPGYFRAFVTHRFCGK